MTPQPASSESTNLDRRPDATPGISGLRLWLFRLMALALAPCLLLALEGMLRLSGYGYATSFLQPVAERDGWWTTNPQFSWRFFPRHLARSPVPFELSEEAEDQRRIFIIGGSAARGTPDSAYNFGRMLGVMLEHSYPEIELEIFNAAMTAINSHVARVIVDDLEPRRGDLFIIYMGNNEVVGPFGAGTIFGQKRVLHRALPSLPAIRASIALNATRSGQLLASLIGDPDRATSSEWRGMEMFVEQVVDPADPRLAQVRSHFRSNLASIIQTLQRAGADILLMTVATNLRDQAPFASLLPSEVTEDDARRWHELYETGRDAAASGSHRAAVDALAQAAEIEDRHAELRFHLGQAHLALGAPERAKPHLIAARDLDALRFRADTEINQAIRGVAEDTGVPLLDVAQRFRDGTDEIPELPGYRLFHEHVHFNFAGNYALASAVHQHLAPRLDSAPPANPRPQLTQQQVAERLAFTRFDELELERDIL
ncbi:MAG: SGNH/GDSL hydrolase family protein, partial [Acidobacteriota bacterium]